MTYKNNNLNFLHAMIILLLLSILKHFDYSNLNLEIAKNPPVPSDDF